MERGKTTKIKIADRLPLLNGRQQGGLDHNPARKDLMKGFMETKNTRMNNADDDLLVERLEIGEHFSSEPDNTHLYVPKEAQHLINRFQSNGDELTSMQPRTTLPWVSDGAVRNHAVVLTTTSAATVERQRSFDQLKRMAAAGNEDAVTTLAALEGFVIENDSTTVPYDTSVERIRVGNGAGVSRRK